MLVISYTKTRLASGKDKLVARFLPEEVGDLLVKYLSIGSPDQRSNRGNMSPQSHTKNQRPVQGRRMNPLGRQTHFRVGSRVLRFQLHVA